MALKPLDNNFLFAFVNETRRGAFIPKNKGKIIIAQTQNQDLRGQGDFARWAKVLAIGPKVKDFKRGDIVLIDKLQWTKGFVHDEVEVWKSNEAKVLAIADDESVAYDYNCDYSRYL